MTNFSLHKLFKYGIIQSSVNKFLQGFENGCLKYYAIVHWWAVEHFEGDFQNLAGMFLHSSVDQICSLELNFPL